MNAHIDSQRKAAVYNYTKKATVFTVATVLWTGIWVYRLVGLTANLLTTLLMYVFMGFHVIVALGVIVVFSYALATGAIV